MSEKCMKEMNEKNCPCPETSCKRHGICCQCLRYHLGISGLPACVR